MLKPCFVLFRWLEKNIKGKTSPEWIELIFKRYPIQYVKWVIVNGFHVPILNFRWWMRVEYILFYSSKVCNNHE